ncbi:MAG: glycosyltransferase family 4 protein [Chthoniobacterales bacterium]|nr:glycosyltransferase family 4 protein [Chthoniobacterales bacterium]
MKILFFMHETTWSGAPIQLLHLITWLKEHGEEVAVAVPKPDSAESGPISDALAQAGVPIFPIVNLAAPPDLAEMKRLCALFDTVVANTLVMWAAVRAANEQGVPVLWYIHESLVARHLIAHMPEIQPALDLADLLVMPTRRTAGLYTEWTARPIEVVPYGIPEVRPGLTHSAPAEMTFLLLGTYEPRKGQDLLLQAIGNLEPSLQKKATFRLAGRVLDRPYHEALVREAAKLPSVQLLGPLSHEDALAATATSDVLVCASRDETMPVAILEAMSLSRAIITTAVGGVAEWLRDGENALLVPPEDSPALAAALCRCLDDRALVDSLGKNARQTFLDNFSLEQLGRRFSALLERLRGEKTA